MEMGLPQDSRTTERGKAERRKTAKEIQSPARPETSSQRHSNAQRELDGGSGALPFIHCWPWDRNKGKQPSRPSGPRLLVGSMVMVPPSQPTPASNPSQTRRHLPLAESLMS